jgi:hypothetical protein
MCSRLVSETAQVALERHFGAVFSGLKISFPGTGDHKCRRRGSNAGTTWQETRASDAAETIPRVHHHISSIGVRIKRCVYMATAKKLWRAFTS